MYLEFGQFDVDFCLPHAADANTGVAAEFIPFRSTDKSPERDAALAATIKMLREGGMQLSGGSSGIPDSYVKLRTAGAVARETLKAAAAARTGRSEEHTSELQSLMRISYAVFCLKKKTTT